MARKSIVGNKSALINKRSIERRAAVSLALKDGAFGKRQFELLTLEGMAGGEITFHHMLIFPVPKKQLNKQKQGKRNCDLPLPFAPPCAAKRQNQVEQEADKRKHRVKDVGKRGWHKGLRCKAANFQQSTDLEHSTSCPNL
ncbi:hypothetical protein AV540_03780 [Brevibacillus parabrevis]|nr:hypothetical protein AV540_03780 [Brevibacillus parabrevis]